MKEMQMRDVFCLGGPGGGGGGYSTSVDCLSITNKVWFEF